MSFTNTETVRGANGLVLGYVTTDAKGGKTVRDVNGNILGYYDPNVKLTRDFHGNITSYGDTAIGYLYR